MTGILQHRRSSTSGIIATTPAAGEMLVNTDWEKPVLGDGATAGGILVDGARRNTQTGTSYVILNSDVGKLVTLSNGSPVAVTIAAAGSSAGAFWPNQARCWLLNIGAGLVTITPTTSTINGNATLTLAQGEGASLFSDGSNYFAVKGATVLTTTLAALTDVAISAPANDDVLVYNSGTGKWTNHRARYTLGFFSSGVPTASQIMGQHRFAIGVTIPANFGAYLNWNSEAGGTATATASTVFNVDKAANATPNTFANIGTITFAAGTVTPTFATSGGTAQAFSAGDVLRIVAPASADATFAGFYTTLVGFES